MLLQKQVKELGEWFQDTYKGYELKIEYTYNKTEQWEEYYLILEGPEGFKPKCVGIIIKDEYKNNGQLDFMCEKFVSANKRAITQVIDMFENRDLAKTIATKEIKMTIPSEAIEEVEAKAKENE